MYTYRVAQKKVHGVCYSHVQQMVIHRSVFTLQRYEKHEIINKNSRPSHQ